MSGRDEQQITEAEAIAFADGECWKDLTLRERAELQMAHVRLCMPFDVFHEAVEKTLGRPVYTHEFGLNWKGLSAELFDGAPPSSLTDVLGMLPSAKSFVVVAP